MTPEREQLRVVIEAHNSAVETVKGCEDALAKANRLYCELQEKCAEYESLAHDMMVARAEQTKLALVVGETPSFGEPPEGFAAKRIVRDHVRQQMDELAETISVLEGDLEDARLEAAQRSVEREEAAERVFIQVMNEKAAQFEKTILEARRLSYQLRSAVVQQVSRVTQPVVNRGGPAPPSVSGYYNAPSRPVAVPQSVKVAAMEDVIGNHELHHGFSLRNESTAQVAAFWQTLKFDHLAQLDGAANVTQPVASYAAPPTQPEE